MSVECTRVIVSGRVQGVWFRESTRRMATETGVTGWVKNLPDGSVEALFEGPAEKVASAVDWCRKGPDRAFVASMEQFAEEPKGLTEFQIRY